jgi:hypothetical protein
LQVHRGQGQNTALPKFLQPAVAHPGVPKILLQPAEVILQGLKEELDDFFQIHQVEKPQEQALPLFERDDPGIDRGLKAIGHGGFMASSKFKVKFDPGEQRPAISLSGVGRADRKHPAV